jgi:FkbM family methyltransferase
MSVLANCTWKIYRAADGVIRGTGLRKSLVGQKCMGGMNWLGARTLRALFWRRSKPFLIHGQQMYLVNSRSPSPAFVLSMILDRYEPATTRFLERTLRPGMTVVDVGAHVGFFTLLAARLVGSHGRVYAFEPDPSNYAMLEKNIALNSYGHVVTVQKAVASDSGEATLLLDPRGNDRNVLIDKSEGLSAGRHGVEIETIGLDAFLEKAQLERVHLLKMDVEGAEYAAIQGMSRSLQAGKVEAMIFEFTPAACEPSGVSPEKFIRQIVNFGFSLYQLQPEGEIVPVAAPEMNLLIAKARTSGSCNLLARHRNTRWAD